MVIYAIPLKRAWFCVECEVVVGFESGYPKGGVCPVCGRGRLVVLERWLKSIYREEVGYGRKEIWMGRDISD